MTITFGKCALYGMIGVTAQEAFVTLAKHYKSIALVIDEATVPYQDIIVIDTVQKLMSLRNAINDKMSVVVCDSLVNIETLASVHPLDYSGDFSKGYTLVKYKHKLDRISPVAIQLKAKSALDLALGTISHSRFLSVYNKLMARMNKPARKKFRKLFVDFLRSGKSKDLLEYLDDLIRDEVKDAFINMLKSRYFTMLSTAAWAVIRKEATADYAQKMYKLDDSYEIVYLVKMIEEANVSH